MEEYVTKMMDIDKGFNNQMTETVKKLEEETASIMEKIAFLEGPAEQVLRLPKLITSVTKSSIKQLNAFQLPRKTVKIAVDSEENVKNIATKNSFAVLNSENKDVKDVTPAASKIRPIMMKLFPNYNLILQDLRRSHP
ncbi:hypothetical protein TNCT_179891 [Trichonephila clavata]|uniref:Uncharacterized protein n=1 Tax=Trichonephila clavata TaxID=2740835 RepID=A0A8X6KCU9_TRICU|nr:hypothetical protein TNCT_179891 [Trichonephila clavata]